MKRLGYTRYVAQGGDWGAIINDVMATQGHPELIGLHTNLPNAIPPEINKAAASGGPPPSGLSDEEKRAYETVVALYKTIPTQLFMGSHPQTLYGIADSPVGVAAWLIDHDPASMRLIARAFDGESTGLTRDDVLDNATLFWLTNTVVSAARLYWEGFAKTDLGPKNITIPVALSIFPTRCTTRHGRGRSRRIPTLSITTSSTRAVTSRRGNSRSCWWMRCGKG